MKFLLATLLKYGFDFPFMDQINIAQLMLSSNVETHYWTAYRYKI